MRNLLKGLKLIIKYVDNQSTPLLWVNDGTIPAHQYQPPLHNYDPAARLPCPTWRIPSAVEKQALVADGPVTTGAWLAVLPMPSELLAPFQAVHDASRAEDVEPIRQLVASDQLTSAIAAVRSYLARFSAQPAYPLEGGFIFVGHPGKVTLTYAQGPRYIGLHVDSFYQVPLEERAASPNRICINLGAGDRYLYFINLPLTTLKEKLDGVGSTDPRRFQIGSKLGTAFMEQFPDYPVVKIRIAPGEAYIAPTENMIHDGSSQGNCYFDVHLTFRGHFAIGSPS